MGLVTVFGASGRQGLAQVRQLVAAGYDVRALSRRPDPFFGENFAGVEVMPADMTNDADIIKAFAGADAVFYTHPLRGFGGRQTSEISERALWLNRLGTAAHAAGVKRFVWNTSGWIPDRPGDAGIYGSNTEGINALWRSGVPATAIGPTLFMDNLLGNWAFPSIVRDSKFVYAHPPGMLANWISLDDTARCMIAVLDRPDMEGAWINVGGPERLTPHDISAGLSDALGRTISYEARSPREFGYLLADGYGDDLAADERTPMAEYVGEYYEYNNNAPTRPFLVNMEAMQQRLPIRLETFREWAKRQDWNWSTKARPPAG